MRANPFHSGNRTFKPNRLFGVKFRSECMMCSDWRRGQKLSNASKHYDKVAAHVYLPDDPNRRHLLFFRVGATGAEHIGQRVVTLMTRVLKDVRVVR